MATASGKSLLEGLMDEIDGGQVPPPIPSPTSPNYEFDPLILDSANRHGVHPDIVRSIIRQESGGNPRALSGKGAMGLMQLMPGTARDLGVQDPFDPAQNIEGGTRYFSQMLKRFGGDTRLALAAYNAGPEAVQAAGGIPHFPETQRYVPAVLGTSVEETGEVEDPDSVQNMLDQLLGRREPEKTLPWMTWAPPEPAKEVQRPEPSLVGPAGAGTPMKAGPYEPLGLEELTTNALAPSPLKVPTTSGYPLPKAPSPETGFGGPYGREAMAELHQLPRLGGFAVTSLLDETRAMASGVAFTMPYWLLMGSSPYLGHGPEELLKLRDRIFYPDAETDRMKQQMLQGLVQELEKPDLPETTKQYVQKQIQDLSAPVPPRNAMEYLDQKYGQPQTGAEHVARFVGALPLYMEEVNPAMVPLNLGGRAIFRWVTPKAAKLIGSVAEELETKRVIQQAVERVAVQAEEQFRGAYWDKAYAMAQEATAREGAAAGQVVEEQFAKALSEHVSQAKALAEGWILPQAHWAGEQAGWAATAMEMGLGKRLLARGMGAAAEGMILGAGLTQPAAGEPPDSYANRVALNAFVSAPVMGASALGGEALSEVIRVALGSVPRAYTLGPIVKTILDKVEQNTGPEGFTPAEVQFLEWLAGQARRKGLDITVNGRAETPAPSATTARAGIGVVEVEPEAGLIPYAKRSPIDQARSWIPWITEEEIASSENPGELIQVAKARQQAYIEDQLMQAATPEELESMNRPGAPRLLILKGIEDRLATPPPAATALATPEALPPLEEATSAATQAPWVAQPTPPEEPPSEGEFGAALDLLKGFLGGADASQEVISPPGEVAVPSLSTGPSPGPEVAVPPETKLQKKIATKEKGTIDLSREDFVRKGMEQWTGGKDTVLGTIAREGGLDYASVSDAVGKDQALWLIKSKLNQRYKRKLIRAGKTGLGTDVVAQIAHDAGILDLSGQGKSGNMGASLVDWLVNTARDYEDLPGKLSGHFDEVMVSPIPVGDAGLQREDIVQLAATPEVPADTYRVIGTKDGIIKLQDDKRVDLDPFTLIKVENLWPGGKAVRRPKGGGRGGFNLGEQETAYRSTEAFDGLPKPIQEALIKTAKFILSRGVRTEEELTQQLTAHLGPRVAGLLPGLYRKLVIGVQNVQPSPTPRLPVGVGGPAVGGAGVSGPVSGVRPSPPGSAQTAQVGPPVPSAPVIPQLQKPAPAPKPPARTGSAKPAAQARAAPWTRQAREGGIATISRELMPPIPGGLWESVFPPEEVQGLSELMGFQILSHQVENAVRTLWGWGLTPELLGKLKPIDPAMFPKTKEGLQVYLQAVRDQAPLIPRSRDDAHGLGKLIADTPGTGKTLSALLTVHGLFKYFPAARILVLTNNEDLIRQWIQTSKPLGMTGNLLTRKRGFLVRGDKVLNFMTYSRLGSWRRDRRMGLLEGFAPDVVISDECQAGKRQYMGVNQALAIEDAAMTGKNALFLSATPFESILHMGYLRALKLWGGGSQYKGFTEWLGSQGVWLDSRKGVWNGLSSKVMKEVHELLVKRGLMVRSDMDFHNLKNSKGEKIMLTHRHRMITMTDQQFDEHTRVSALFDEWMQRPDMVESFTKRRLVANLRYLVLRTLDEFNKVPAAIELAKEALVQGRMPILTMLRLSGTDFEEWYEAYLRGDRKYGEKSFMPELLNYLKDQGIRLESPMAIFRREFPEFVEISGDQPAGSHARNMAIKAIQENTAKGVRMTVPAGGVGLDLQDKIGNFQRSMINLTTPYTAMMMRQVEGRPLRLGSESSAVILWLFLDTPMDRQVAGKAGALAQMMGAALEDVVQLANADELVGYEFPGIGKGDVIEETMPEYKTSISESDESYDARAKEPGAIGKQVTRRTILGDLMQLPPEPSLEEIGDLVGAEGAGIGPAEFAEQRNLTARGVADIRKAGLGEFERDIPPGDIQKIGRGELTPQEAAARSVTEGRMVEARPTGPGELAPPMFQAKASEKLSEDQRNLFGQQALPLRVKVEKKPSREPLPSGTFQPSARAQLEALENLKREERAVPEGATGGPLFEQAAEAEFSKKQMSLPELSKSALAPPPVVALDESFLNYETVQTGRFYPIADKRLDTGDVAVFFHKILKNRANENCLALYLKDGKPLAMEVIGFGKINTAKVDPNLIPRSVLALGANQFYLAHNHPSGNPDPSQADVEMTRWAHLAAAQAGAGEFMGHIIIDLKRFGLIDRGGKLMVLPLPQADLLAKERGVPEIVPLTGEVQREALQAKGPLGSHYILAAEALTLVKDDKAPSTVVFLQDAKNRVIRNLVFNLHLSGFLQNPEAYQTLRKAMASSYPARFSVVTNENLGEGSDEVLVRAIEALVARTTGLEFGANYTLQDVVWKLSGPEQYQSLLALKRLSAPSGKIPAEIWEPPAQYLREPGKIRRTEAQLIKALGAALRTPIRTGRLGPGESKTAGLFYPFKNLIRLRHARDVPVSFHEIGHALDQVIFGSRVTGRLESVKSGALKRWRSELSPLAPAGTRGPILQEGLAEFMRHFMDDPQKAQRIAPTFYKWFDEDFLTRRMPKLKRELYGIRSDYQLLMSAEPWDYIGSTIESGLTRRGGVPRWLKPREWSRAVFDTMEPIRRAVKDIEELPGGRKPPAFKDPSQLISVMNGWANPPAHFIRHGTFPWNNPGTVELGPGLEEIIRKTPGDPLMFQAYAKARYAISLLRREHQDPMESVGIPKEKCEATVRKFGDLFAPHYKARVTYARHVAEILRDAGLINEKTFSQWPSALGDYSPLWRILDEVPEEFAGRQDLAFRVGNLYQPIKRRRGGRQTTLDADEALARMTFMVFRRAYQNEVAVSFLEIARGIPGAAEIVHEVPERLWPVTLKLSEVLSKLHLPAAQLNPEMAEHLLTLFRPSWFQPPPGEMWVWHEGKRKYLQFRPDVYRALMSLDRFELNLVVRALGSVAQLKRAGAAIFSPTFMFGRIPMNIGTALIQSDKPLAHAVYLIPSFLAAFLKHGKIPGLYDSKDYWKFMASGGGGTFFRGGADSVIAEVRRNMAEAAQPLTYWSNPIHWFHKGLGALSLLGSALELSPRISEARVAGLRGAVTRSQTVPAAVKGRENPADYLRIGYVTAFFNHMTAFFGPNIAHLNRTYREFKEHPSRSLFRMSLLMGGVMLYYMAVRDDDRWKKLDRRIRDGWFVIPVPGEDLWIRLRKPGWFGTIMSLAERTLESLDAHDPRPLDEWGSEVLRHLPLPVPDLLMPVIEVLANQSYFFGRRIAPERGEPSERYYPHNTDMAKRIGSILEVSPAKVDYLLDSWSGGLWSTPSRTLQSAQAMTTGEGKIGTGWYTLPGVRGLFYSQLVGESDVLKEFYEEHWIPAREAYESLGMKKSEGIPEARQYLDRKRNALAVYYALRKVATTLDLLQDAAKNIRNDEGIARTEKEAKILALRDDMDRIAAQANARARFISGSSLAARPAETEGEPVMGGAFP